MNGTESINETLQQVFQAANTQNPSKLSGACIPVLNAQKQVVGTETVEELARTIGSLTEALNNNDQSILGQIAYYIDINSASALGSTRVDVGGNTRMRQVMEDSCMTVLMDANGNYCELNRNDARYTIEGEAVVDTTTGALLSKWANADVMGIVPERYGRVVSVTSGSTTFLRCWFSPMPLPGGYVMPQMVVGKFKASLVDGAMRSIPYATPDNSKTINAFWNTAQVRSKNHGLANLDFRNHLLFHMMGKYGWRDSQNCKTEDNTLVWGVGLDGTENTTASTSDGFARQRYIKTGKTMTLGMNDGRVEETDSAGGVCHSVNVAGFENPWGQYWEMVQGLCSVGTTVYCWRGNFLPTGTPTAASFANVDCVTLTRPTSAVWAMNIIADADGQGVYMIPKESLSGVSYGDHFWYDANGQLWLFGGYSSSGPNCGLASASSYNVWSSSNAYLSARLAYYGDIKKVSPTQLATLLAA